MIPFSPPHIDEAIIREVADTLRSGWITTGPKTKLFEKKLTDYYGSKSTLCLNSATAGLELILRWFGVKEGDEVIVPAYTYCATANVVLHCGAKAVFTDVNPSDFNISVEKIKAAITDKTKVIIPVDFAGYPCDYDEINALVNNPAIKKLFRPVSAEQQALGRILVLADSAHSIGARYKGRFTGSITDAAVFSFHAVKNLITAEGGAIALNLPPPFDNGTIYRTLAVKSLHGQNKDALAKTQKGAWRYDVVEPGYKYNMTDLAAAIGLIELSRYSEDILPKRKKIFDFYSSFFSEYSWAQIPEYENQDKKSSYHVYALRIKNISERERDDIIKEISEREVSVNVHFIPVPMMSFYHSLGYNISNYPAAFDCYSREISLPVYYDLTENQMQTVAEAVAASVKKVLEIKK